MTAIGLLFPLLAILALTARFYAWRHQPRSIAIDEILILPAAVRQEYLVYKQSRCGADVASSSPISPQVLPLS